MYAGPAMPAHVCRPGYAGPGMPAHAGHRMPVNLMSVNLIPVNLMSVNLVPVNLRYHLIPCHDPTGGSPPPTLVPEAVAVLRRQMKGHGRFYRQ